LEANLLRLAAIPLGAVLPRRSSSLPGSSASHAWCSPIWPCSGWGLPCRLCRHSRGGLLPRTGLRRPVRTWGPATVSPLP